MEFIRGNYIKKHLFEISLDEVSFVRRGFRKKNAQTVRHLEAVGKEFLFGYHLAIEINEMDFLAKQLNRSKPVYRGFAFEGAAMGLALLDYLLPWRKKRLQLFIRSEGKKHIYMVYVGIGWALARIPWLRKNALKWFAEYDPLLKWLILDGYGFHQGYFQTDKYFKRAVNFEGLSGYSRKAFVQGLGRCLWFVEGANVRAVSETIAGMPGEHHADLWSGVGLACAYAGGADRQEIKELKILSASFLPDLAQGVVFASASRMRAGNLVEHTENASLIICHRPAAEAASIAFSAMDDLPQNNSLENPAYEVWRRRIRQEFTTRSGRAG